MPCHPPVPGRAPRARRAQLPLARIALSGLLAVAPAGAAEIRVGADKDCDYSSLLSAMLIAAVDPAGSDDILIAGNQSYTGVDLYVSNQNLRLIGGYASCAAATPTGRTTLDGTGGSTDTVIESNGDNGPRYTHHFENLVITGGEDGGVSVSGDVDYAFVNVEIASNSGPGLALDGPGPAGSVDWKSSIHHNVGASFGGGIYCIDSTLTLSGDVEDNEAANSGGGIYANGCPLSIVVTGDRIDIARNDAINGAGLTLRGTVTTTLTGTAVGPVDVHHNGDEFGSAGGIAIGTSSLTGVPTVILQNAWVRDNVAYEVGGVQVTSGSFTMERTLAGDACHTPHRCSWLARNRSTTAATDDLSDDVGGAIFAEINSDVTLRSTVVEENEGTRGSLAHLFDFSVLTLENVTISGNRGREVVWANSLETELRARHVASAGNLTFDGTGEADFFTAHTDSIVEIDSSIVLETIRDTGPTMETYDCLLHGPSPGAGFSATRSFAGDPDFASVGFGDLSLGPASEAYDRCDGSNVPGITSDLELASRPVDDPGVPNSDGSYDLGAYEGLSPRYLFADGFEVDGTAAWSSTVG